jgi:ribose-phosphate pyrophosphokinase
MNVLTAHTISSPNNIRIFSGLHSNKLSKIICNHLNIDLGNSYTDIFPDGEIIVRVNEDVRGRDCFVVLSTSFPTNDNLMELMIFIDCLRRSSAKQIVPVIPYFGYARQDRKDKGRVPITAKLVANLITKAGADRIIALDLHAAQIQGFFDIPVDHLSATPVFLDYFKSHKQEIGDLCLVSPDVGNVKVAEAMANMLNGDLAIINKKRLSGSQIITDRKIIGDVRDKTVLLFDDMISTGNTVCEAAKLVINEGAKKVIAAATHGLFSCGAIEKFASSSIDKIITTNSVPTASKASEVCEKFIDLCVGKLLAESIYRVHNNLSVSEMFNETAGVKR